MSKSDKEEGDMSTNWSDTLDANLQDSFNTDTLGESTSFTTETVEENSFSGVEDGGNGINSANTSSDVVIRKAERKTKVVELNKAVECGIITLGGMLNGAIAGYIFGGANHLFSGLLKGRHKFPGFGGEIMQASRITAGMFTMWLGTYEGSKCAIKDLRKQTVPDKLTTFGSGFLAGCVSSLRMRNMNAIMTNGIISGVLVTLFDSFKAI